jgi:serine phosphatase RsbU (regulator of sigma subunit)/CHASE3 domain sensor protein
MLLRRRLLLLFVSILVGVLLSGGAAAVVLQDRDSAQARERELSVALERVAQLAVAYTDQETGERGFALTGEPSFLEPYTAGRRRAETLSRGLREIVGTPQLRALVASSVAAGDRWQSQAEREIALRRTSGAEAAATSVATGAGKARFDQVRGHLATLSANVQSAETAAARHLDAVRRRLTALIIGMGVAAVLGAVVAAVCIRRWVTRPIDALAAEVRRVRAGALDSPIMSAGPPELATLALDVDAMRGRIQQQLIESERSRQAVEQSAAVVLTLRSTLEPDVGELPDGWTVAGTIRAAEGVIAGDCYDLFSVPGGALALVVVDIAGHGATEGILALRCKEILRAALSSGQEPGAAIATVAEQLDDMGPEAFLTAFVAVISTDDGRLRYANAGHPPALIITAEGHRELERTGPLVGLLAPGWETAESWLPPGANLCAYTDGVIECRNDAREFFGPERLVDLLHGARCDEAPTVVTTVLDEVLVFSAGGLRDDATIVVLCRPESS